MRELFRARQKGGKAGNRLRSSVMMTVVILAGVLPALSASTETPTAPRLHTVLMTAGIQLSPPQVRLTWEADSKATAYRVSRKHPADTAWTFLTTLAGSATQFEDDAIVVREPIEYQVAKATPAYNGYGYIAAGIDVPALDQPGTVVLVVASTYAAELRAELAQLQQDLIGDGWQVIRHDVASDESVTRVKALITSDYEQDPERVKALFLFGRVPVPYSGDISPDGHPNHQGAWPADVYYGDLHGEWTDSSVTSTNAERSRNWNVPGDGKFDQSSPPGNVDLQIGRVDLSSLTSFSNKVPALSEKDLLRRYLEKNHAFRHGLLRVERRGVICDNFFDKGDDPVGCSGWRNFTPILGVENIVEAGWSNYFPTVSTQSYLWSFASGGGQYYTCTGVGSSDDFAEQEVGAVFTLWLGSYFGDWDNESNFLRAALGSSPGALTSCYAGFPQWLYHPMGLGQTTGFCARLTQNNRRRGQYLPLNPGAGQVHIALLGDPTLRMLPVLPPSGLTGRRTTRGVRLSWSASMDSGIRGYYVYRASGMDQPFTRLTPAEPLTATSFLDSNQSAGATYMVRAIKAERTSSGTYLNPSQGVFVSTAALGTDPSQNTELMIRTTAAGGVEVQVFGAAGQSVALEETSDLASWAASQSGQISEAGVYSWAVMPGPTPRFFRCRALPP